MVATSIDSAAPVEGTVVEAAFGDDGHLTGSAGCNRYSAPYTRDGDRIAIGPVISTRMFCAAPAGVMEQEAAYLAALERAASVREDDAGLTLLDADRRELVAFTAAG
jgi:heat shock protein HslJ